MSTKILQCTQSDLSLQCVAATCCCNKSPDLYSRSDLSPWVVATTCRLVCSWKRDIWMDVWLTTILSGYLNDILSKALPSPTPKPPPPPLPSPTLQRILSRIGDMISSSALRLLRLQNSPVQALKNLMPCKPILRGKRPFCSLMSAVLSLRLMHYLHFSHTFTNLYKLED